MSNAARRVLELFHQTPKQGVTGVTGVTGQFLTPENPMVTPVTPVTYLNQSQPTHYVSPAGALSDVYDLDERAAIAIYDGGISEAYAAAFAQLQIAQPIGVPHLKWQRAIDDAGRFLDQWGNEAERLQWSAEDLFTAPAAPSAMPTLSNIYSAGLCWLLDGAGVDALDAVTATLSDGRSFSRFHAKLGSDKRSEET
jgi:hypothetical protein